MSRVSRVPLFGRLHPSEYVALVCSFMLLTLETLIRTITLLLPSPIIRVCYRISGTAFNFLAPPVSRQARQKQKAVSSPIARANDFVDLCELYGYYAEEHIVQTGDGYLLGLHRLGWRRGEEEQRVNAGPGSVEKKVVYLHHGLMMNSEVWVCLTDAERCLPFVLVEQGYDVWLGNNRGNKYSKKNLSLAPTEIAFWDFSMDQFAFHDIPDSINYILETTQQPSLSYIGFSQGSAQAFAALSIHPNLNNKVDVFVALAPAMAPPGLASGVVASLCKSNPEVLFLAFGRRAMLGSATMWQALLYPAIFVWFIDKSLDFLFGWKTKNISLNQKLAAYPHLYSFTSTKSVVHWFQIIRNGTFQMFDDEFSTPLAMTNGSKYYKVAKFPTRNIKTPIVLLYGGSDSLVDIELMLKELPKHTVAKELLHYEHLDCIWSQDVDRVVFPHVLEALETYTQPSTKTRALGWQAARRAVADRSSIASLPPGYVEDEHLTSSSRGDRDNGIVTPDGAFDFGLHNSDERTVATRQTVESDGDNDDDDTPERYAFSSPATHGLRLRGTTSTHDSVASVRSSASVASERTVVSPIRRMMSPRLRGQRDFGSSSEHSLHTGSVSSSTDRGFGSPLIATAATEEPPNTTTEGWWSSTGSDTSPNPSSQTIHQPQAPTVPALTHARNLSAPDSTRQSRFDASISSVLDLSTHRRKRSALSTDAASDISRHSSDGSHASFSDRGIVPGKHKAEPVLATVEAHPVVRSQLPVPRGSVSPVVGIDGSKKRPRK